MKLKIKILPLFVICTFSLTALVTAQTPKKSRNSAPKRTTQVTANNDYEPQVISRATDSSGDENNSQMVIKNGVAVEVPNGSRKPKNGVTDGNTTVPKTPSSSEQTRQKVDELSAQVNALTQKINSLEEQQRSLLDLERLSRAEQRAESLRKQLDEAIEKQSTIQSRLDQIEFEMKPENISQATAVIGSLRPEEVREQRRKGLETEKTRLQTQLSQAQDNQSRIQIALKNADDLVDKLRRKIEADVDSDETPPTVAPKTKSTNTQITEDNGDN